MISRRSLLQSSLAVSGAAVLPVVAAADSPVAVQPVRFCLNTSTVRGQKLSVPQQIDLAATSGYDAIEPWIRDLDAYVEQGGRLPDVKKRLDDAGLAVASAIGFAEWIVDDDDRRRAGLETMRRDMQTLAAIGGSHIAAPPIGMHMPDSPPIDLDAAGERYAAVLDLGRELGVTPQLEVWGFSPNLSKLAEVLYVAAAAARADACVLPDIYHLHRGGNSFDSIGMLSGAAVHCFHLNDITMADDPSTLTDADRVYPGRGDAPIATVLRTLAASGFDGVLSLELFNKDYWQQPAGQVARTGLDAMKSVAREAGLKVA